jgi:D-alanyl-D-alanine carboxypeptidase
MKKYFKLFLILLLLNIRVVYAEEFNITSDKVILYNMNDDKVLYELDSDKKTQIASLTKIMSVIVGIENNDNLDEEVIITRCIVVWPLFMWAGR